MQTLSPYQFGLVAGQKANVMYNEEEMEGDLEDGSTNETNQGQ